MNTNEKSPLGSIMPILFLGLLGIVALQLFTGDTQKKETGNKPQDVTGNSVTSPSRTRTINKKIKTADFIFRRIKRGTTQNVETDNYFIQLSTRGARIERLYLKSREDLKLPLQVIERNKDPLAIQHNALELTRNHGMDFQPHIYYSGDYAEQLASPPLNQAAFQLLPKNINEKLKVQEVAYTLPLNFRGHRLKLHKVYRFYPSENYFRQITILRNLEKKEMNLSFEQNGKLAYGSLFFKTFGDLGPKESQDNETAMSDGIGNSGRFFYYNGSLTKRNNHYNSGGGGCGFPMGCTSADQTGIYTKYLDASNTLQFSGSNSRYFFAYSEFLAPKENHIHQPDGFIYKNAPDMEGQETMTNVFLNFRLGPKQEKKLNIGSPQTLIGVNGQLGNNRHIIANLQKERSDALILDMKVYIGARSDSEHNFSNTALMQAAFNQEEANADAAEAIYLSGYTAFFSKISNSIIWVMRWLYNYVGNYGWCIILIALGFKFITFPLNQMQVKSMQRMSAIRPEIEAINKQFGKNPQEKQKRMMQLFKKHNYNPAKGCLPMLVQMPIFMGLYSAFSASIELWHSPFILWMNDLSKPDTAWVIPGLDLNLNILPLLMVSSQILYQRFTTVAADAQQKMLMYFMPLLMLVFFWKIPSGVTLYWTVQNIISIIWQKTSNILEERKKR